MPRPPATLLTLLLLGAILIAEASPPPPTREPLVRVVDLNVAEAQKVMLADGAKVSVSSSTCRRSATRSITPSGWPASPWRSMADT